MNQFSLWRSVCVPPEENAVMAGRRSSSYRSPFFFFCSFFLLMDPGQITQPDFNQIIAYPTSNFLRTTTMETRNHNTFKTHTHNTQQDGWTDRDRDSCWNARGRWRKTAVSHPDLWGAGIWSFTLLKENIYNILLNEQSKNLISR